MFTEDVEVHNEVGKKFEYVGRLVKRNLFWDFRNINFTQAVTTVILYETTNCCDQHA